MFIPPFRVRAAVTTNTVISLTAWAERESLQRKRSSSRVMMMMNHQGRMKKMMRRMKRRMKKMKRKTKGNRSRMLGLYDTE